MKSRPLYNISQLGVQASMTLLGQFAATAGQFANLMQDPVNERDGHSPEQKSGEAFASALTNADIATETYLAVQVMRTFGDASFYGEEASQDRVSPYIPSDRPFLITADPIDGTLYYKNGLPIFSVILTLCRGDDLVGSVIAMPAKNVLFTAYREQGVSVLRKSPLSETGMLETSEPFSLQDIKRPKQAVLLGNAYIGREQPLLDADIQPIFPFRDYQGQKDWDYCLASLLTGECCGILMPDAQLIDAGAVAFAAQCGGGIWRHHGLQRATKRYQDYLAAVDERTAELLERVRR